MNACVVVTGDGKRVTVFSGVVRTAAIRVEGRDPDLDVHVELSSELARDVGEALIALADVLDEQEAE